MSGHVNAPNRNRTQTSRPRSHNGVVTRVRLLATAKAIFEDSGFLDARISDRARLSHGAFYHYFDSKEQIFREVAEVQEALLTTHGDDVVLTDVVLTELERIHRANQRYLSRYRENGRIMDVIEEVSRHDSFVNDVRMQQQKHVAERAIRRLHGQSIVDPDVDPEIAAIALSSMIGRFGERWFVKGWSQFQFEAAVEQVTKLWANAIGLKELPTNSD